MGNPLSRFFDLIRNPSYSRTTTLLVILTIVLAIPLTVFVAQQQQELRQQAACSVANDGGGCGSQGGACSNGICLVGDSIDANGSLDCQVCTTAASLPDCDIYAGGSACTNGKWFKIFKEHSSGQACKPVSKEDSCPGEASAPTASVAPSPVSTACKPPPTIDSINICPAPLKANPQQDIAVCNGKAPDCSPHQLVKIQADGSLYCFDPNTLTFVSYATCTTAAVPPTIGGGTCNVAPFTIGSCTQADRDKQLKEGLAIHGSCKRVCQAGTARAGQEVDGISYKECQSNFCWYDSYHDKTPAKIEEGKDPKYGPGWCYGIPGQPDPCTVPVASGNTRLSFTVGLDGLGETGDFRNSNSSGSNKNPKRPSRKLFYEIFDSGINRVAEGQSNELRYDPASGKFKVTVDLGKNLASGNYIVKVRAEGYLVKIVRKQASFPTPEAAVTITAGQVSEVPAVNLHVGDINLDRRINVLDHDILASCWLGTDPAKCNADSSFRIRSDLDDNGSIDQFDYNLLLREFPAPTED